MSAHRLALSSFLRHGPRFTLPQHSQFQTEPLSSDEEVQTNGRLSETVVPYVNLLNSSLFGGNPSIGAPTHWIPSIQRDVDVEGLLRKTSFVSDADTQSRKNSHVTRTVETSVQTESHGDSWALEKRADELHWQLENDIGEELMREGMHTKAIERFYPAASFGNSNALFNLADCLFNGIGVISNKNEAVLLWKQGADFGHVDSMHSLAIAHLTGKGTAMNANLGLKWMKKASCREVYTENGHVRLTVSSHVDAAFYMVVHYIQEHRPKQALEAIRTASRSNEYSREMRSWVHDECVNEEALAVLKHALGIGTQ